MPLPDYVEEKELREASKNAWDYFPDDRRAEMLEQAHGIIEEIGLDEFICFMKAGADLIETRLNETEKILIDLVKSVLESRADMTGAEVLMSAIEKSFSKETNEEKPTLVTEVRDA